MSARAAVVACALASCGRVNFDLVHVVDSSAPNDAAIPGLLAWYPMDGLGAGAPEVLDASGHGHDGSCRNGCPMVVAGRVGNAYQFDGTVMVQIPVDAELEQMTFTVAAWINFETPCAGCSGCALNKPLGTADLDSWQGCIETDTTLTFNTSSFAMPGLAESSSPHSPRAWHHLALAFDGSNGSKRIFFDGTLDALVTADSIDYDGSAITVGSDLNSGMPVLGYVGLLDDVRIYDHVLDASELAALQTP